jgi:hypothetical protein
MTVSIMDVLLMHYSRTGHKMDMRHMYKTKEKIRNEM